MVIKTFQSHALEKKRKEKKRTCCEWN